MSSHNTVTIKGLSVWLVCALFFLYEFFLRTVIGTFQHPIMYDLEITSMKFSFLSSSSYQLIYAIMQIPAGLIIGYHGLRNTMVFAISICVIASLGFALSNSFEIAVIFRMLAGFGSSFGFICLLVAVFDWLPHNRSAFYIGLSQFIGTLGPVLAAGPIESLVAVYAVGWRLIFIVTAIVGVLLLLLVYFIVENNHDQVGKFQILKKTESITSSLKKLFSRSQPILIATFSACIYFFIEYLSENEGKAFIELKGHAATFASYMITISWLGYGIGCPSMGYLSDKYNTRKALLILSACFYAIGLVCIIFCLSKVSLLLGFLCLGFGSSGASIGFAIMSEQFKQSTRAIGLAFNNGLVTCMSAFNAPLIGYAFDLIKNNGNGISLVNYQYIFSMVLILLLAILILSLFLIKETFCKSQVDFTYLRK